jgi:hypothetical protein
MSLLYRIYEISTRPVPVPPVEPPLGTVPVPCRRCDTPVYVRPDYLKELWGRPICLNCLPPWFQELPYGYGETPWPDA